VYAAVQLFVLYLGIPLPEQIKRSFIVHTSSLFGDFLPRRV
jgi:hypothetical protein